MILHLTRDYPPRRNGGLSTAVAGIVRGLEHNGLRSRVVSFDGWGRRGKASTDHLARPASTDTVLRVRTKEDSTGVLPWVLSSKPALVHVHDALLWPLAKEIADAANAPLVHTLHVLSHHQDRLRGLDKDTRTTAAQREAIGKADMLIAPSASVAEQLVADIPLARFRLETCPLGVELPPERASAPSPTRTLFVGRFSDMAGVGELGPVIAALDESITLTVCGGLPDNPRAEARWTETLAAAATQSKASVELVGWQSREDLTEHYAKSAILVVPSLYATFGLTVAEAMASELAVCAYRVGGLVDLIEDGVTGVVVDPSPTKLARAVGELARDGTRARALAAAGRERIAQRFGLGDAGSALRAAYAKLIRLA